MWTWMVMGITEEYQTKQENMCTSGIMYLSEDQWSKEKSDKKFYNKVDDKWDYYSGLPNPKAYEKM